MPTIAPRAADRDDAVATLRAAVADLTRRVVALERERPARPVAQTFGDADAAWLAAVADAVGAATFTASELHDHAAVDPSLRRGLGPTSTAAIGYRLRALKDRPMGAWVVRLVKRSDGVRVWTVAMVEDRHGDRCDAADGGV